MKKLFTLVALLTCFLGAKAVEIEDFKVDYTTAGKTTLGWKAAMIQDEWITADEDGLHLYNPEVTPNFYDYQLWIFSGAALELDQEYTIKITAKVSDGSAEVRCRIGDWGGGIAGTVTVNSTEYAEYTYSGKATVASSGLLVQFGDYVGTVSFKSISIVHDGREQKEVDWKNIITNGDAAAAWTNPNAAVKKIDGDYAWAEGQEADQEICAWSKEFNNKDPEDNTLDLIHPATIQDGAFVVKTDIVDPVLVWAEDGEQWGTPHSAGDPMPDNEWQNQFWINLPRPLTEGEPYKVSFKYKASEAAQAAVQAHKAPGKYLGDSPIESSYNFTTEWQPYTSKELSAPAGMQSIAFNLGVDQQYLREITFYFTDIKVELMDLKEGFFVAGVDTKKGGAFDANFNYDTAVEFEKTEDEDGILYVGKIGTVGDETTWVDQVMISTQYGHDKAFKASTIKPTGKIANNGPWIPFTAAGNAKINLPVRGVWQFSVDPVQQLIGFVKLDGEPDKIEIEINPNPTEIVINAVERNYRNADEATAEDPTIVLPEDYVYGNTWDNQFFIYANRTLKPGEVTVLEFDYSATTEAKASAAFQGLIGETTTYVTGAFDLDGETIMNSTEQHFSKELTIPAQTWDKNAIDGVTFISFDLACIKGANTYTFKNVVWKLADDTESLINQEGSDNFKIKIGAGTSIVDYGTDGISTVTSKKNVGSAVIYNLAGQRVSNGFKGIVIKDGKKYVK